ncbi:hypothetical protein FEJ81_06075 [Natrinema versiforme]|uniref:Uncharacterized protein n=1 Tax=Natrinema versiforme TaxID=88724 RepID=A0A4P8WIU5_9EURY|nr:hypothetical protein FEJ81_06075 [Natrinema versiforme]
MSPVGDGGGRDLVATESQCTPDRWPAVRSVWNSFQWLPAVPATSGRVPSIDGSAGVQGR